MLTFCLPLQQTGSTRANQQILGRQKGQPLQELLLFVVVVVVVAAALLAVAAVVAVRIPVQKSTPAIVVARNLEKTGYHNLAGTLLEPAGVV